MGSTDASRMLSMQFVVRIACSVVPTLQASFGRRLGSTVSPIVRNATRTAFQREKLQIVMAVFMPPNVYMKETVLCQTLERFELAT